MKIQNQGTVSEQIREAVSRWRVVTVEALKMLSVVPLVRSLPQIFLAEPKCTAVEAKNVIALQRLLKNLLVMMVTLNHH